MLHKLIPFCDIRYLIRFRVLLCLIPLTVIIFWKTKFELFSESKDSSEDCPHFDVVYTWVNGSDPEFTESIRQFDPHYDPARFDDKNELKYSLRSLEKYAPWVRKVYIVTNGQIPHWIDLSYDKVSVIPHSALSEYPEYLPTFSSSAIETFIHRIPNLSKRFIYMNDDIFLGAPLYPEDLYTQSEGVRVYTAWTLPDCAIDCPWVYIGDGACDQHCNIPECQFDGGDCIYEDTHQSETKRPSTLPPPVELPKVEQPRPWKKRKRNSFKDVIKKTNLSTFEEMKSIVESFNSEQRSKAKPNTGTPQPTKGYKSSVDIFSQSLIHTNRRLNKEYGFKARNVLAHVGFLLDRDTIYSMQNKFRLEVQETTSRRFRDQKDLQFAFLYYSYVMSETMNLTVSEIFDQFDTDGSLTWSDREVRTFLSRIYPLPLDWSAVRYFEEVVSNCSQKLGMGHIEHQEFSTLVYERYEDSSLPTITRELVCQCSTLAEVMVDNFAQRPRYKFNMNSKRGMHSNFMMLTSNLTEVVDSLDRLRRSPKKFNCINDNLEPQYPEENELIRHLLEDFYLSFFPKRSRFELPERYRNRFNNYTDYEAWRWRKGLALFVGYSASILLIVFLLRFCCMHKAKFVRRYVQKK
ncbi:N-acetylglucosamine-1-phosphotransferase subunits alpha/beta [Episyrphus balteatus]|uniref:N-acetylglucosamine-1-phosphotransferase subunits alpha/beta n=1 Tax=Episyrphus balteatus TaxID=286459 RepID=UPI002484F5DD|nr:N-acetylglucosamine-1-phosphotransferase subunits alpha/beta [Episyrphus balteatus]